MHNSARLRPAPLRLAAAGLPALLLAACAAASPAAPPPEAASPYLLQFVGEYDAPVGQGLTSLSLHVDGSFDATVDGRALSGSFGAAGASHAPSALLEDSAGGASSASFAAMARAPGAPAQVTLTLAGALGSATLVAPWVASNEAMCDATGGRWSDDDPDPATGVYCRCSGGALFLPSRGGCVAPVTTGDPARRALSSASKAAAGRYAGRGRIASLTLAADGTFEATIDGARDQGTWWAEGPPGQLALTSAAHAFAATIDDGRLTAHLDPRGEDLGR